VDFGMRFRDQDDPDSNGALVMKEVMLPICSPGYRDADTATEASDGSTVIKLADTPEQAITIARTRRDQLIDSAEDCEFDYFWDEYLLYQPRLGFRWLTCGEVDFPVKDPLRVGVWAGAGAVAGYTYYNGLLYRDYRAALPESLASLETVDFLVDTVIEVNYYRQNRRSVRSIEIVKSRGQDYETGEQTLHIAGNKGLQVFRRVQAPLRRRMEREIQFSVVDFVESGRPWAQRLRPADHAIGIRASPGICVGERVQTGTHFLDPGFEDLATRDPNCRHRLFAGPIAPKRAEVVDLLGRELERRIDGRIADNHRRFSRASMFERIVNLDEVRVHSIAAFEQHSQQMPAASRFPRRRDARAVHERGR